MLALLIWLVIALAEAAPHRPLPGRAEDERPLAGYAEDAIVEWTPGRKPDAAVDAVIGTRHDAGPDREVEALLSR